MMTDEKMTRNTTKLLRRFLEESDLYEGIAEEISKINDDTYSVSKNTDIFYESEEGPLALKAIIRNALEIVRKRLLDLGNIEEFLRKNDLIDEYPVEKLNLDCGKYDNQSVFNTDYARIIAKDFSLKWVRLSPDKIKTRVGTLSSDLPVGERETIIKLRTQQGIFRKALIHEKNSCFITGVKNTDFLIASHIQPYRDSVGKEKYTRHNGLLLAANYDKAFDKGYISFSDDGLIMLAKGHEESLQIGLSITPGVKLANELLTNQRRYFLNLHRENVFENF